MAGKWNRQVDEGYYCWNLTYFCYNNLGLDEKRFIALREMCGQADPVAEHFARLRRDDAEWEDMLPYKAKERKNAVELTTL